jgi:hypothetical protein
MLVKNKYIKEKREKASSEEKFNRIRPKVKCVEENHCCTKQTIIKFK